MADLETVDTKPALIVADAQNRRLLEQILAVVSRIKLLLLSSEGDDDAA